MTTMQQHVDKLDALKQGLVNLAGDPLRRLLQDSDLVEIALNGSLDDLKDFTRGLYETLAMDMRDELAAAADSAETHANAVVKRVKS